MDAAEFRKKGREMVDYIADYLENIGERRVLPEVKPGYLRDLLPNRAPKTPEPWTDIMADIERTIMPGVGHTLWLQLNIYIEPRKEQTSLCVSLIWR